MRAWEPEPKETAKAFAAFKIYRDMGIQRSLKKTAIAYYGSAANIRQIAVWSSKFDWVERVKAYDARDEMMIREAMDVRLREEANREVEEQLELKRMRRAYAKKAAKKADDMLSFPTERRELEQDGRTIHIHPARWSFATPSYLDTIVAGASEPSDQQEGTSPEFERLLDILQRSKSGERSD